MKKIFSEPNKQPNPIIVSLVFAALLSVSVLLCYKYIGVEDSRMSEEREALEEFHSEAEVITCVGKVLPEAEYLGMEDKIVESVVGEGVGYVYKFNNKGIEFTYEEYQSNINFLGSQPLYDSAYDSYCEKLYEYMTLDRLREQSEKVADIDFRAYDTMNIITYYCKVDSYDDLDNVLDAMEDIYNAYEEYLFEEFDYEEDDVFVVPPMIAFGVYCPNEKTSGGIEGVYPSEPNGYLNVHGFFMREDNSVWNDIRTNVKERYKENIQKGYIIDTAATPDKPN